MSKYPNHLINYLKYLRCVDVQKLINRFHDEHLFFTIDKYRLINRLRKQNILEDISSFEKFIKQELNNIINRMIIYDVMNQFKNILNTKNFTSYNSQFVDMDLYNEYYVKYCKIRSVFISKSKEFTFYIKENCLCKNEIVSWRKSFYKLKELFKTILNRYQELEKYITNKLFNMMLINKFTRKVFCLDDDEKSSFETNKIILKLKDIDKESIIDIIKTYINWYSQTFEGYVFRYEPLIIYENIF